jgi:hypothetical protein
MNRSFFKATLGGVLMLTVLLTLLSCENEYPDKPPRGSISGTVFFSGTPQNDLSSLTLVIAAYAEGVDFTDFMNPGSLPHGTALIPLDGPTFPEAGIAYDLENLYPYRYNLISAFIDLNAPDVIPTVFGIHDGLVEVTLDAPTNGIDIHLQ